MSKSIGVMLGVMIVVGAMSAAANPVPPEPTTAPDDPVLKEIGELRTGLIDAFNKRDIDKVLSYLHPEIVVTWADARVSHGPGEVRKYYDEMMTSPNHLVESLNLHPVIEGRKMYGPNVAISYGTLGDEFKLNDGTDLKMNSRFSSLLVKENGKWLMKGFHASGNLFSNPVQTLIVKKVALWTAIITLVIGMLAGYVLARIVARKKAAKKSV